MKLDPTLIRATLGLFLDRLDQVHPGMLPVVVLALVLVIGAAAVALAAILAAGVVATSAAGVMILGRRAIHAAATFRGKAVTA